jgi:C4-dicarboxylate transporter DctM subunit
MLVVVMVIGGIYSGVFTPIEAAAMSAVYAFIIAVFVYKDLRLSQVPKVLLDSASMSAMLLYIITNAVLLSHVRLCRFLNAKWGWLRADGLVAPVFVMAPAAPGDVRRQPQAPG